MATKERNHITFKEIREWKRLQEKQPEIHDNDYWGEGVRSNLRKHWEVLESDYDHKTRSGTIRFKTNDNRVYVEEWRSGERVRLFLDGGE